MGSTPNWLKRQQRQHARAVEWANDSSGTKAKRRASESGTFGHAWAAARSTVPSYTHYRTTQTVSPMKLPDLHPLEAPERGRMPRGLPVAAAVAALASLTPDTFLSRMKTRVKRFLGFGPKAEFGPGSKHAKAMARQRRRGGK